MATGTTATDDGATDGAVAGGATDGAVASDAATGGEAGGATSPALSNQELRALKKALLSTERKMVTVQGRVDDAEDRLRRADPTDYVALGDIQREIDALRAQLEQLELAWLETSEALEG